MQDQDTSSPLSRIGRAVQRLFRTGGESTVASIDSSAPVDTGLPFPALVFDEGVALGVDKALTVAPLLLVLDAYGGNSLAIVDALASRPVTTGLPFGVRLPIQPPQDPREFLTSVLTERGVKLKTNTVDTMLRQGQVVWLVEPSDGLPNALHWLTNCVRLYPATKALVVAQTGPPQAVTLALTPVTVEMPIWSSARQWLSQSAHEPRVLFTRVGIQAEARNAIASSHLLRQALRQPLPSGGRLSALYTVWAKALLGFPTKPHIDHAGLEEDAGLPPVSDVKDQAVFVQAARLAWGALTTGEMPTPDQHDPLLTHLLYQPTPGQWVFNQPALQHYLAAHAPQATLDVLVEHLENPDCREVIALWSAHAQDAPELLTRLIREIRDWRVVSNLQPLLILALRMIQEMGPRGRGYEDEILIQALNLIRVLSQPVETASKVSPATHASAETTPPPRSEPSRSHRAAPAHPSAALIQALADHQGVGESTDPAVSAVALARRPSAIVRAAAVSLLGILPGDTALRELRARMADDDAQVAQTAAQALGAAGSRALPLLMLGLNDTRDTVRDMAVLGLAQVGEPAIPQLTEALGNRDPKVAQSAAQALGRIGGVGVRLLIQALSSSAAAAASLALVEAGQRDPTTFIAEIGQTSGNTRVRLAEILRQVGAPVLPVLVDALSQPGHPASDLAVDVLAEAAPHDPAVITGLAYGLGDSRLSVRMRSDAAIQRLGPTALPAVLRSVADRPELQGRVIEIAARMPGVVVDPPLVNALLRVLRTARPDVRLAAVRLLGQAPDARALDSLIEALSDPDPLMRVEAARALGGAQAGRAVDPLKAGLRTERNAEARAAMVEALAHLDPVDSIPQAISALGDADDRVRKAALAFLRQTGARAVDPLIETVCQVSSPVLRANAIELLADFAGRAGASAEPGYLVARVWHSLLTQRHSASGARERTAELGWWGYGREVHLSYTTAEAFSHYEDIREFAEAPRQLYWITEDDTWLRPQVQEVLKSLERLGAQVQVHLSAPGLDSTGASNRRLGLTSVEYRLRDLEDALDATRLDLAPFVDVVKHWRELVRRAIVEASGAADLVMTVITPRVRLHNGAPVTLAFLLKNMGDGAARAIRVSLDQRILDQAGLSVAETVWMLPVIDSQQTYRLEFQAQVRRETPVDLHFKLRFEDAHRLTQTTDPYLHIDFYREKQPYRELGLNPYIAGPPIRVQEMFFGRRVTLKWIEDQLLGKHGLNVLILYGERRTGKTSVLYQIERQPRFAKGDFVFALVDLQQMAYWMDSTAHFYYGLAQRVTDKLVEQDIQVEPPALADFVAMPGPRFDRFVRDVMAALQQRTLVIMLDEFDLLLDRFKQGDIDQSVAHHIRALIQHQNRLAFIFTGAHAVRAMIEDPKTILFNTAFQRQIGFLREPDARDLICQPVEGLIEYDELAVERILEVTHGHPYFIQYICHAIFEHLQNDQRNFADLTDVTEAMREVVQDAMGNIANGYAQLRPEHQLILAALAKVSGEGRRFVNTDEVVQRLEEHNINMTRRERDGYLDDLKRRDFIEGDPPSSLDRIGFTMELVRMWLAQRADRELRNLADEGRRGKDEI